MRRMVACVCSAAFVAVVLSSAQASEYEVLVPLSGAARTEAEADADFGRVKGFDSRRPVFTVGVFNMFADELVAQEVELDRPFESVRFIDCRGRLEGNKVILESVPAWSFAGFEVRDSVRKD